MKDMNFKIGDELAKAFEDGYQEGLARSRFVNSNHFKQAIRNRSCGVFGNGL